MKGREATLLRVFNGGGEMKVRNEMKVGGD